jgi:polyisoprenoid-binding protein YceI
MNMLRIISILCSAAALLTAPPAVHAQQIDYSRSQITFISRQMNVPVEAKFNKFTAQVSFDPAKPESSKAAIEIDVASFDIGNDEINGEVQKKEWFDVKNFPRASFVSSSVRALGGGRYEVRGPLAIKGRTHDITAPFSVRTETGGGSVFEGTFSIRRLQYNIGEGVWKHTDVVADEIQIRFRLHAGGKPPARK